MDFDPDEYLGKQKSAAASDFDPDDYLKTVRTRQVASLPATNAPQEPPLPRWAAQSPHLYAGARVAREVLGPVAEMLGSIGGAAAGAAAGTVASPSIVVNPATGAVAGAALAYGGIRGLLDRADEILGLKEPPKDLTEVGTEALKNLGTGAAYEMGGQMAGKAIQKGLEVGGKAVGALASKIASPIADIRDIPRQKAAKLARAAAGDRLPEIQNALASAPAGRTASEAIAYEIDPLTQRAVVNAPETQALLKKVEELKPGVFTDASRATDAANRNMLAQLAGGATQAGSVAERASQKASLNALTSPMREAAQEAANVGGKKLTALLDGVEPLPKEFVESQIKRLEQQGLKPLLAQPVINDVLTVLKDPAYAANDLVRDSASNVAKEISQWTSRGGVIDSVALDSIRKNAVNATIAKLRPGLDQAGQKEAAASVLSKIKPVIDDAIEAAGGTQWREYLQTHAEGMKELSKTKLGAKAMELYTSAPQKFVDLVENNSPKVVEKIFGGGTYDIAKAMGEEAVMKLRGAGKDISRAKDIAAQATAGQKAFDDLLKEHFFKFQLPNMLNIATTATNKVLDILTGRIGKKTMAILTESAKSAKSFDELLSTLPASERSKVLKVLKDPNTFGSIVTTKTAGGIAAGADDANRTSRRNALSPELNENALTE